MAHAVATAVESAHVVGLCASGACECWLRSLDLLLRLDRLLAKLLLRHAWVLEGALGRRRCSIWALRSFFRECLLRRLVLVLLRLLYLVLRWHTSRWREVLLLLLLLLRVFGRRRIVLLLATRWWRIVLRRLLLRRRRRGWWGVGLAAWRRRKVLLLTLMLIYRISVVVRDGRCEWRTISTFLWWCYSRSANVKRKMHAKLTRVKVTARWWAAVS